MMCTSTPQLPFKRPQIPSYRDHKALNRATFGGSRYVILEVLYCFDLAMDDENRDSK